MARWSWRPSTRSPWPTPWSGCSATRACGRSGRGRGWTSWPTTPGRRRRGRSRPGCARRCASVRRARCSVPIIPPVATAVRRRWAPSATAALGRWWEPLALAALILAFVGITLWWLGADGRAPDYDEGRHLGFALDFHNAFDRGDLTYWFNTFTQYPPFVHLVGALGFLLGPLSVNSPVVAQNLFFLPLLAIGCYGAGSVAYGRRAGVLAAVFALATPMVIDQFHEFMVDAPTAAMVAVTVWLILASRRFERWPIAALAGLAAGLGQMCKAPFVLFIAGFALVVLVRGGWRNWRGVLAFVV